MNIRNRIITAVLTLALVFSFTACGKKEESQQGSTEQKTEEARKIIVAVAPGFYPITYADDNGNAAGYDVDVFKAIDELLPQYEFVYEVVAKETMNVGVETGTYQVGINSMFKTAEREKIYLIPENNMGYTAVSCVYTKGLEHITSFKDVATRKLKAYPTGSSGSIKNVIEAYNKANPDEIIEIDIESASNTNEGIAAVQSGEYDVYFHLLPVIKLWSDDILSNLGIADPLDVVPTYPIINKNETQLNADVNDAIAKLRADGTLSKFSVKAFGYDVFDLAK